MSKQGDLVIESALKKLWETYDCGGWDTFPALYVEPQMTCNDGYYNVYSRWFECNTKTELFFMCIEICDFWEENIEIRLCAYSPQLMFEMDSVEHFVHNKENAKYTKLNKLVEKINNEFRFNKDYLLTTDFGLTSKINKAGCCLRTTIHSYDNLEHHFRRFFDEAQKIFGYMVDNF